MTLKITRDDLDQFDATGAQTVKTKRAWFDSVWDKLKWIV